MSNSRTTKVVYRIASRVHRVSALAIILFGMQSMGAAQTGGAAVEPNRISQTAGIQHQTQSGADLNGEGQIWVGDTLPKVRVLPAGNEPRVLFVIKGVGENAGNAYAYEPAFLPTLDIKLSCEQLRIVLNVALDSDEYANEIAKSLAGSTDSLLVQKIRSKLFRAYLQSAAFSLKPKIEGDPSYRGMPTQLIPAKSLTGDTLSLSFPLPSNLDALTGDPLSEAIRLEVAKWNLGIQYGMRTSNVATASESFTLEYSEKLFLKQDLKGDGGASAFKDKIYLTRTQFQEALSDGLINVKRTSVQSGEASPELSLTARQAFTEVWPTFASKLGFSSVASEAALKELSSFGFDGDQAQAVINNIKTTSDIDTSTKSETKVDVAAGGGALWGLIDGDAKVETNFVRDRKSVKNTAFELGGTITIPKSLSVTQLKRSERSQNVSLNIEAIQFLGQGVRICEAQSAIRIPSLSFASASVQSIQYSMGLGEPPQFDGPVPLGYIARQSLRFRDGLADLVLPMRQDLTGADAKEITVVGPATVFLSCTGYTACQDKPTANGTEGLVQQDGHLYMWVANNNEQIPNVRYARLLPTRITAGHEFMKKRSGAMESFVMTGVTRVAAGVQAKFTVVARCGGSDLFGGYWLFNDVRLSVLVLPEYR